MPFLIKQTWKAFHVLRYIPFNMGSCPHYTGKQTVFIDCELSLAIWLCIWNYIKVGILTSFFGKMSTDYQKLSQAYHAANVNKKKHILQEETNVLWREIKKGEKQFDV